MFSLRRLAPLVLTFLALVAVEARAQGIVLSFSHESGHYPEAIEVSIEAPLETTIRYTLDGSIPNDSSMVFSGPVLIPDEPYAPARLASIHTARDNFHVEPPEHVRRATVIRAIGYGQDGSVSDVFTNSYFVGSAVPDGDLPVFSLVVDSTDFFGYDEGIYVPGRIYDERFDGSLWIGHRDANYMESGREWERDVLVQFFEDGVLAYERHAGARIHGGATRAFRQKTLRLYARTEYGGGNAFDHPLFGDPQNAGHRRLLLRNGGQDFDRAMLRDPLIQRLVGHLNFETQAYRPVHVFLNGEYWGIHNLRERYDDHELSRRHGVNPDDVIILEGNAAIDTGLPGDARHFLQMRHYLLENDVDEDAMDMVRERLDLSSFIDYHAAQIIVGNEDWPGNNIRFWRIRDGGSGGGQLGNFDRWRYMMFDLDAGFHGNPANNTLVLATEAGGVSWPNYDWSTIMLRRLLTNEGFRAEFIHRMSDLMNTALLPSHVMDVVGEMGAEIEPAIAAQLERWRPHQSIATWRSQVNQITAYASVRPTHVRSHMQDFFGLVDEHTLTIDVPEGGGAVRVNHERIDADTPGLIDPRSPYPWSGEYFGGVPLRLTALPEDGFRFAGWRIGADSLARQSSIDIVLSGDTRVEALFDPITIDAMHPDPHVLSKGPFIFDYWSPDEPAGSFPYHMGFQQTTMTDPGLRDEMTGPYHVPEDDYAPADQETIGLPYNNTARTRINGLGDEGISFINTGRGRDLGAAIVALDTRGVDAATVTWIGGTVLANSRVYHIRLQYRVGEDGVFHDVVSGGVPVEYHRRNVNAHSEIIGPVALPSDALDQAYVQLRWKYYYTGERLNPNVGQRDELRLDDIRVEMGEPAVATRLAFERDFIGVQAGHPLPPMTLLAVDDEGQIDTNVSGDIALEIVGSALPLPNVAMQNGRAVIGGIAPDLDPGPYRLRATKDPLEAVEVDLRVVQVTEVVMPRFIQGETPDNFDRVPFAYRLRFEGLEPGATYRFGNRIVNADDPTGQNGGGNRLFRTTSGAFVRSTDAPRFRQTDIDDRHGRFTTLDGIYEAWFVTEPSGNRRFMPGEDLQMLVMLNDGRGGEDAAFFLRSESDVRVIRLTDDIAGGTGFTVQSDAPAGSVLMAWDTDGEVLNASVVQSLSIDLDDRYAQFYRRLVENVQGAAGLIIPNDMEDGIAALTWVDWHTGEAISHVTAEDGYFGPLSTSLPSGEGVNPINVSFASGAPTLQLPTHEAIEVNRLPTLVWSDVQGGGPYIVELARQSNFVNPVFTSAQTTDVSFELPMLEADARYFWRVGSIQGDAIRWSSSHAFNTGHSVSLEDGLLPEVLSVDAPYPNPTSGLASIRLDTPTAEHVRISIYDMLGRRVAIARDELLAAGRHRVELVAHDLPSGMYVVRVEVGATHAIRTMTVAR